MSTPQSFFSLLQNKDMLSTIRTKKLIIKKNKEKKRTKSIAEYKIKQEEEQATGNETKEKQNYKKQNKIKKITEGNNPLLDQS